MATILAYTSPALGHLYPMTALLMDLQRRGHHVAVRTLADGVPTALAVGFDAEPIDSRIERVPMTDWTAPNSRAALKITMGVFAERAQYEIDDARSAIESHRPDAMIVDANCWGQRRSPMPARFRGRRFGRIRRFFDPVACHPSALVSNRFQAGADDCATRCCGH